MIRNAAAIGEAATRSTTTWSTATARLRAAARRPVSCSPPARRRRDGRSRPGGDRDPAEPDHSGRAHGAPARRTHHRPRRRSRASDCRSIRSSEARRERRSRLSAHGRWGARIADAAARRPAPARHLLRARRRALREFAEQRGLVAAHPLEAAIERRRRGGAARHAQRRPRRAGDRRAERGRHVFVEKPIATRSRTAERMRDACAQAGVTLAVGHGVPAPRRRAPRSGAARARARSERSSSPRRTCRYPAASRPGLARAPGAQPRRSTDPARHPPRRHARVLARARGAHTGEFAHLRPRPRPTTSASSGSSSRRRARRGHRQLRVAEDLLDPPARDRRCARLPRPTSRSGRRRSRRTPPRPDAPHRRGPEPVDFERRDPLAEELDEFARCIRGGAAARRAASGDRRAARLLDALPRCDERRPSAPAARGRALPARPRALPRRHRSARAAARRVRAQPVAHARLGASTSTRRGRWGSRPC